MHYWRFYNETICTDEVFSKENESESSNLLKKKFEELTAGHPEPAEVTEQWLCRLITYINPIFLCQELVLNKERSKIVGAQLHTRFRRPWHLSRSHLFFKFLCMNLSPHFRSLLRKPDLCKHASRYV